MSWREMVRSKRSKLAACVVVYLPFCGCSAVNAVDLQSLEDRAVFVQSAVQLHQQASLDPATAVRAAVSALDPFTVVHATNLHKLPGAGGAAWGPDNTKSFGGVMVSDGPKQSTFGAIGGSDGVRGTSHGVYGGASSERPGRPLFAGAWHSNPGGVKVAHATPTADGGLDVSHTEHTFGSLPPGSSIEEVLAPLTGASPSSTAASPPPAAVAAAASPTVPQAAAAAASLAAMAPDQRLQPEQISEILKQPFSADSITVAFRKPDAEKGPGWGKDDVLAAGGQFTSSRDLKGGFGGVGGYSTQDQKFHILYGGGLQAAAMGQVPGGAVGAIVGKPGEMDLTHLQPTADGGADVTNMHSNTRHVDSKELQKLLTSGTFSWPSASQAGAPPVAAPPPTAAGAAPPAAPAVPTAQPAPASTAAPGSAAPAGGEATTTAAAAPGATTAQPSFEPGSPEEAWGRITERMGDITEDLAEGKLPPIVPESWATSTAARIAMIIAKAFAPVKESAEFLLKEVLRVKAGMFSALNMTYPRSRKAASRNHVPDPAVPAFEVAFYRGVKAVLVKWKKLHESVLSAAGNLTQGLLAANQTGLAKRFNRSLTSSDAALTDFAQHLENAVAEVPGSSELSPQQLGVILNKTNAELYEAMRSLTAFGPVAFARPVQDLVDKVSDMLSTIGLSPELVRKNFGAVEHVATAVQWRVRGAGRELVVGGHQAVVAVCERLNLSAPSWPPPGVEPVTEPLVEGEGEASPWWASWFSAAREPRGPGVLMWLLLGLAASLLA